MQIYNLFLLATICLLSSCGSDPVSDDSNSLESSSQVATLTAPIESIPEEKVMEELASSVAPVPDTPAVELTTEEIKDLEEEKLKAKKEQEAKESAARKQRRKERAERKKRKAEKKTSSRGTPSMEFTYDVFDFGKIMEGEIVEHSFRFKNTGDAPLTINSTSVSCGCTTPSYPFIPIAPGEEGVIGFTFNSKGKLGTQKPSVTLVTNARPSTYKIYLKGLVDTPREADKKSEIKKDTAQ